MSIRPFSINEIESLREIFEKNGWKIGGHTEDTRRYSIKKNNLLSFTIKIPVKLPGVKLNIPYEVVTFKVSIAFKLWYLNNNTYKIIAYIMKALEELEGQAFLKPGFDIEGKIPQFLRILNAIFPEDMKSETERSWINRVRIALMNKRDQYIDEFKDFDTHKIKDMVKVLDETGFKSTFKLPWELKMGVPKIRTSETLLFANEDEKQDEFFIIEKGHVTYFKDIEYNKLYIRTFFESYNPYILHTILTLGYSSVYQFEVSVRNWIILSRILLNSLIEILSEVEFNQSEFVSFRAENEFLDKEFEEESCNFPLSALNYESSIAKELFDFHVDLLDSPPTHFELIESSLLYYTKAEALIRNYKFAPAIELLNDSIKIFNKYHQVKAVVSVLLLLRKIAQKLNQHDVEQNYLQNALSLALKGDVPDIYILSIRYKLGKAYFRSNQLIKAQEQFILLNDVLEASTFPEFESKKKYFDGMINIYLGLIFLKQERFADSKKALKQAYLIGNTVLKIRLKFCLLRGIAFKENGKISQAIRILTIGLNALTEENDGQHQHKVIEILIELASMHIYHRKNKNKAAHYLEEIEKRISLNTIRDMQLSAKWNILMSDYYKLLLKKADSAAYYIEQARNLKFQLKEIGVREENA
ncbi:MAG: tetratricopeptide repeat protein [Promethearchaeota archaeon]